MGRQEGWLWGVEGEGPTHAIDVVTEEASPGWRVVHSYHIISINQINQSTTIDGDSRKGHHQAGKLKKTGQATKLPILTIYLSQLPGFFQLFFSREGGCGVGEFSLEL